LEQVHDPKAVPAIGLTTGIEEEAAVGGQGKLASELIGGSLPTGDLLPGKDGTLTITQLEVEDTSLNHRHDQAPVHEVSQPSDIPLQWELSRFLSTLQAHQVQTPDIPYGYHLPLRGQSGTPPVRCRERKPSDAPTPPSIQGAELKETVPIGAGAQKEQPLSIGCPQGTVDVAVPGEGKTLPAGEEAQAEQSPQHRHRGQNPCR